MLNELQWHCIIQHCLLIKQCVDQLQQGLTKLSSLLATIEANLCSPASSEMRNTYSGAVT